MQAASDAVRRVFIGGIDHTVTEANLREHFSRYGEVSHVTILQGKAVVGARAKPFAFLNFGQPATHSAHATHTASQHPPHCLLPCSLH